ncbi:enoyl-CoA hydratase/isomerase family protein [Aquipuribacter nitratireducens]|uniref:Enoyl-CoA hydratase/isomerase family protein n=1 Tax=Aquipuribacter nitratireducens TaxID=650104 RepID=A0ABW0GL04_9MICO
MPDVETLACGPHVQWETAPHDPAHGDPHAGAGDADWVIGTVRLVRPPMNPIGASIRDGVAEAVRHARADARVRGVVVTGGDVFAAGADIKEMAGMGMRDVLRLAADLQGALDDVAGLPVPTVAAVSGFALGGGFELALACDHRVLDEGARVGLPEITLGLVPGAGGTQRLARLVGPGRAKDLVWTGRMVNAAEALELGLADEVAPAGTAETAARARLARYATAAQVAVAAAKQAVDAGLDGSLAEGLQLERGLFAGLFGTRDAQAGLRSFVEQGPGKAVFEGS